MPRSLPSSPRCARGDAPGQRAAAPAGLGARPRPCVRDLIGPALLILLPLLLAGGVHLARRQHWPLPGCHFRRLTGLPCATCGSTRALDALAGGRWLDALALNPLLVLGGAGCLVGGGALLVRRWRAPHRPPRLSPIGTRLPWGRVVLVALLLNWVYLLLFQR